MRLCFEVTMDDVIAFSLYENFASPSLRLHRWMSIWFMPLLLLLMVLATFFSVLQKLIPPPMSPFELVFYIPAALGLVGLFYLLGVIVARSWYRHNIVSGIRKLYGEGGIRGVLGP